MKSGKKLNRDQKKLLAKRKYNPSDYLYIKTELANEDLIKRDQRLNKSGSKIKKLYFQNINNGDIIILEDY